MSSAAQFEPYVARTINRQPPVAVLSGRALIRDVLVGFLQHHGFPQATAWSNVAALHRAIARPPTGLVFLDVGTEDEDPRDVIQELRAHCPGTTVVAIGTPMQLAANAANVDGWIELTASGHHLSEIANAVSRAESGPLHFSRPPRVERQIRTWTTLTRRQRQVLGLLGCGVDNNKLADALGISERAVKAHVSGLLDKFKADSRTELALIARHAKLHAHPGFFPFRA